MKSFKIMPRQFAMLALAFVLATVLGALSHELAHYGVMKYYGGHPVLHYASVSPGTINDNVLELRQRYQKDKLKIESSSPSPEKISYMAYRAAIGKKLEYSVLNSWIAGPLQTMLTGCIGFILLWLRRKKIKSFGMKTIDWFWVMLAFFWSRQFSNLLISLFQYFKHCKCVGKGDEFKISRYFGWPVLTLNIITGVIGATVLCWVVFIIIPKQLRFNFIIAGLAGSALGWLVWMEWMGPIFLP